MFVGLLASYSLLVDGTLADYDQNCVTVLSVCAASDSVGVVHWSARGVNSHLCTCPPRPVLVQCFDIAPVRNWQRCHLTLQQCGTGKGVTWHCAALSAGALGGYMWKNRALNQSSETLLSIAGIAAFSLAMGWSNETTVDNLGLSSCHRSSSNAGSSAFCVG